jgi:hypothetical protein
MTQFNRRHKDKVRTFIITLKKGKPCEMCGVMYNYWQMHFDHIDHRNKITDISNCRSIPLIIEEVKKCRLLCANCHADVSFKNRLQYASKYPLPVDLQQELFGEGK